MSKLVIVTWLWGNKNEFRRDRADFTPEHANILGRMLERNITRDYRFVCITDIPDDPRFEVETFPLWDDYTELVSHPHSPTYVSCYPRLKIFDEAVGRALDADVILSLDLDTVVVGSLDSVLDSYEGPFRGLRLKLNTRPLVYNGSMFQFDVGHPEVTRIWTQFDIAKSPELARLFGYRGSDQAWISFVMGDNYQTFEPKHGVLSYRKHLRQHHDLPADAAIVHFFGRHNPWHADAQSARWVQEHYK